MLVSIDTVLIHLESEAFRSTSGIRASVVKIEASDDDKEDTS